MNRMNTLLFIIGASLMSCTSSAEEAEFPDNHGTSADNYTQLVSKTQTYPASYEQEATQRGAIVTIDYDTRDYADGTGAARTNTAQVYLPYGYDEDTARRYNVLYLVHGHYGNASTYFATDGGLLRKVLDNMIVYGDIEPLIVVTPTYNYGQPTLDYVDADKYCKALPMELKNDLIPLVESRYRTYATTTDEAGLTASRQHRAVGGFSMGGVTTWYALDETLSLFRYFLPISGDCWSLGAFAGMNRPDDTAQYLANRITAQGYTPSDLYIWAASGTSDSAYSETLWQIQGMARLSDTFTLSNMTFHEKNGARHEYRPTVEYIYNALPFFFPIDGSTAIRSHQADTRSSDAIHNLNGYRLARLQKGINIINGQKIIK